MAKVWIQSSKKDNFKAPFTTSEAWGTFEQSEGGASITLAYGTLRVKTVELPAFAGKAMARTLNDSPAPVGEIVLKAGDCLRLG